MEPRSPALQSDSIPSESSSSWQVIILFKLGAEDCCDPSMGTPNQGFPRTLKSFQSNLQSTADFSVDKTNGQKWWQIGVSVRNKWLFRVMYLNIRNSFQLLSIIILRTKKQSNWKMGRRPKQTLLQWRRTDGQQAHDKISNFVNY